MIKESKNNGISTGAIPTELKKIVEQNITGQKKLFAYRLAAEANKLAAKDRTGTQSVQVLEEEFRKIYGVQKSAMPYFKQCLKMAGLKHPAVGVQDGILHVWKRVELTKLRGE